MENVKIIIDSGDGNTCDECTKGMEVYVTDGTGNDILFCKSHFNDFILECLEALTKL